MSRRKGERAEEVRTKAPRRPQAAETNIQEHIPNRDRCVGGDVRADRGRRRLRSHGERDERDGRGKSDVWCESGFESEYQLRKGFRCVCVRGVDRVEEDDDHGTGLTS
jgi:hypothetical protein